MKNEVTGENFMGRFEAGRYLRSAADFGLYCLHVVVTILIMIVLLVACGLIAADSWVWCDYE